jgi:3',5'-cyclic AMP phosphodiesterase CpdA
VLKAVLTGLVAAVLAGCAPIPPQLGRPVTFSEPVAKSSQPLVERGGPLRFAIIGDRTGGHRPDIFGPALEKLNLMQPELVMSVGDFIEGYSEDVALLDAEWTEVETMIARLDAPLFYVPGNHDIGNATMLAEWRKRRGPSWYAFRYKDALFLVLDTEDPPVVFNPDLMARSKAMEAAMARDPVATQARVLDAAKGMAGTPNPKAPANFSAAQLAFVERALAEHADAGWTFVFMHKPAWQLGSIEFLQVEEMLGNRDYTVFAGHEHYYAYERRRGRDYVDLATTGGIWLRDGPGRLDHVMWVTLTEDGPRIANLDLQGISGKEGPAEK